jgi:hypothetical protein
MNRKLKGSTKKYREQKVPCKERERLEKAYQDALRERDALEARVSQEVVSSDRSKTREAKNQSEEGLSHAIRILNELQAHERKHGCVGRSLQDPTPTIGND